MDDYRLMFRDIGGFPVIESEKWSDTSFSWLKFYRDAYKYGHFANDIFSIVVEKDLDNSWKRIITVRKVKEYIFLNSRFQCTSYTSFGFFQIDIPKVYKELFELPQDHISMFNFNSILGGYSVYDILETFGVPDPSESLIEIGLMLTFTQDLAKVIISYRRTFTFK